MGTVSGIVRRATCWRDFAVQGTFLSHSHVLVCSAASFFIKWLQQWCVCVWCPVVLCLHHMSWAKASQWACNLSPSLVSSPRFIGCWLHTPDLRPPGCVSLPGLGPLCVEIVDTLGAYSSFILLCASYFSHICSFFFHPFLTLFYWLKCFFLSLLPSLLNRSYLLSWCLP